MFYVLVLFNKLTILWDVCRNVCAFSIQFPITFTKIFYLNAKGISDRMTCVTGYTMTSLTGWMGENRYGDIFILVIGI